VLATGREFCSAEAVADLVRKAAGAKAGHWQSDQAQLALAVDLQLRAALDPLDREASRLEREASFVVAGADRGAEGQTVPLSEAIATIASERNRDRRREMERLRTSTAAAAMGDNRRMALAVQSEILLTAGQGSIPGAMRALTTASDDGRMACRAFLSATDSAYREGLERLARDRLSLPASALSRSDVLDLFLRQPSDAAFSAHDLAAAVRDQIDTVGLSRLSERLGLDLEPRAGKRPRPATVAADPPERIAIIAWPIAGLAGRRALWHELGHALHLAGQRASEEWALLRRPDRAVAEGWAILFGSIPGSASWLKHHCLSPREARDQARNLAVADLFLARRYAARWPVEVDMMESPTRRDHGEAYAESLRSATGIGYSPDEAWFDWDEGFAGLEYLRGWALAAGWSATLREQFDEDWFFNPAAGEWLIEAFRAQAPEADWGMLPGWLLERAAG
jgi:hypothetical protein